MSTTTSQDRTLTDAIEDHVHQNMTLPVVDMTWLIELIADEFSPEDIFSFKELAQWAEDNGYVKE